MPPKPGLLSPAGRHFEPRKLRRIHQRPNAHGTSGTGDRQLKCCAGRCRELLGSRGDVLYLDLHCERAGYVSGRRNGQRKRKAAHDRPRLRIFRSMTATPPKGHVLRSIRRHRFELDRSDAGKRDQRRQRARSNRREATRPSCAPFGVVPDVIFHHATVSERVRKPQSSRRTLSKRPIRARSRWRR